MLSQRQWAEINDAVRQESRAVQRFIERNQDPITRMLGGLQLVGGVGEVIGGVALVGGGVATSEFGVGIAIAGFGAWATRNGYDNFATGWRALTTGSPQETDIHRALRQLGLSDNEATATETLLAGGANAGVARLGRTALRAAAQAGLNRRALEMFAHEPLNVRAGARSIWDEPNIEVRGDSWEGFDAQRTGFERTPRNFRVFDQFDRPSGVAISNKTMDLAQLGYSRFDRNAVCNTLANYVDRVAAFESGRLGSFRILPGQIIERRLHVLFPSGEALPGQALQIAAAEQYAASRGVALQVEYAR